MTVCEKCWEEAQRRLYSGDTDCESVTAIYEQLIEAEWCSRNHDCEQCRKYDGPDPDSWRFDPPDRVDDSTDDEPDPIDPTHPGWQP